MVAVVTGAGLGLFNASNNVLGAGGVLGQALQGEDGSLAWVNAASGNLVLQDVDTSLSGVGVDLALLRTYNAQGTLTSAANGLGWSWDEERTVTLTTGTVNTSGSQVTRTTGDGASSVYTFNGTAYVSSAGGRFQVWLMRADGSHQRRLVRDPGHDAFTPRWAPDGKHLVFTRCTEPFGFLDCTIARVRADGSHLHPLTGGHWVDFDARYAPDGHSIAITTNRRGLNSAIWRMRPDGSRMRRLTAARPEAFAPDYSPNGRTILFGNNFDRPHTDLFTMRRDGSHVRQLTHFGPKAQGGFASYSPDGRRIISDYAVDGAKEGLAVMNSDGTHLHVIVRTGNLTLADWGVQR